MILIQGGPQPVATVPAEVAPLGPDLRNAQKGAVKSVPKGEATARYTPEVSGERGNDADLRGRRVDIDA